MKHETYLRRALELARIHSAPGTCGPFGAVVVRDGQILGEGWNRVAETRDPTAHAEVLAIREAAGRMSTHDLSGCALYASCEPCPMCLSAVYWARIGAVYYAASARDAAAAGFDDSRIQEELALSWEGRTVRAVRLLEEEGRNVLRAWAANPLRVLY
jgi:tRNA(Arg) A34 adenosine deaminase TadA